MPQPLPTLKLSHSQVLWVLNCGQPATPKLLFDLRYLRQLGIPFADGKRGQGRGSSAYYNFEELVECGLALRAVRRRMRPREVAALLIASRRSWRERYRQAWQCQPEGVLEQRWILMAMAPPRIDSIEEVPVVLSERDGVWTIREQALDELRSNSLLGDQLAIYEDGAAEVVIKLGRLVIELVYWAGKVPPMKRGRPPKTTTAVSSDGENTDGKKSQAKPRDR